MDITAEQTATLRKNLRLIYDVCERCDARGMRVEFAGRQLTVRQLFEIEITAYLLYLAAADRIVSQEEIDFINDLMGRDYSLEKCTEAVTANRMLGDTFAKSTPLSFKLLVDASSEEGEDIADVLISFYGVLGAVISASDEALTRVEAEAVKSYVYLLRGYKLLADSEDENASE